MIGSMEVSREVNGDEEHYHYFADVSFKVLFKKYHRQTTLKATYFRDTLVYCSNRVLQNQELKDWRYVERKGNRYVGFVHDEDSIHPVFPILYSVSKLYYYPPSIDDISIFAEGHTEVCDLRDLGGGDYELKIPGGNKNIYKFRQGKIREIFVDRTWFNLKFKLVER